VAARLSMSFVSNTLVSITQGCSSSKPIRLDLFFSDKSKENSRSPEHTMLALLASGEESDDALVIPTALIIESELDGDKAPFFFDELFFFERLKNIFLCSFFFFFFFFFFFCGISSVAELAIGNNKRTFLIDQLLAV
jgi:hypothetical protein